jgi:hypothetical protein
MSKIEVDAIEPQSGTSLTLGASGDTITIPNGATITNSGTATGFGKVLQVVSVDDSTTRTTTSTSFVDCGTLSASITPSSASNKILIIFSTGAQVSSDGDVGYYTIIRGVTNIAPNTTNGFRNIQLNGSSGTNIVSINFLDSPSTTSSTTYKIQFRSNIAGNTVSANWNATTGTITIMEISA